MSFNDVSEAFDGWLESLTVTRNSGGAYVAGRWVEGATSAIIISGVVQNANAEDLKVLPEGNRTAEAIKIHTTAELIAQEDGTTGDTITYESELWLVHNVAKRYIGNYNKAIATRQT